MPPLKNKKAPDDMYQLGEAVRRLENQNERQSQCLDGIRSTLDRVCELLEKFSSINERQTRLEAEVEVLQRDGDEFREFMKNTHCRSHEAEIEHLKEGVEGNKKTDDQQNQNSFTLTVAFLTALLGGAITFIFTK
jgi:archaellum component FlaC